MMWLGRVSNAQKSLFRSISRHPKLRVMDLPTSRDTASYIVAKQATKRTDTSYVNEIVITKAPPSLGRLGE